MSVFSVFLIVLIAFYFKFVDTAGTSEFQVNKCLSIHPSIFSILLLKQKMHKNKAFIKIFNKKMLTNS